MASQEAWPANEWERRLTHLAARLRDAWYAFGDAWRAAGLTPAHPLHGMVERAVSDTADFIARVTDDSKIYHDHAGQIAEQWWQIRAEAARALGEASEVTRLAQRMAELWAALAEATPGKEEGAG
ncbi:MAG: hypothetical protein IMX02_02830 [Limnochordaceae bacterium]|nr:hypothetical protein [Limnochordaceae bacterium]